MDKKVVIEDTEYRIKKDYREAFDENEFLEKYTEYFKEYDYIVGDIAYGKLRLKGFNSKDNKNLKSLNDIKNIDDYIKNNCAYDCKYFILEKIKKND